jgi:hypothetical protein
VKSFFLSPPLQVTQLWQQGLLDATSMDAALELATDGCAVVHGLMRKRLLKAVKAGGTRQAMAIPQPVGGEPTELMQL